VLNAIACTGAAARAKRRKGTPPDAITTGYKRSVAVMSRIDTVATYMPRALTSPVPPRAARLSPSANTPTGDNAIIQPINTNIALVIASKKRTTVSRLASSVRLSAKPKHTTNTTNGSSALSAAALNALGGTSAANQSRNAGMSLAGATALARSRSSVAGSSRRALTIGGTKIPANNAPAAAMTTNSATARVPTRPAVPDVPAIREISKAATSGTTVMRMPFTHKVPTVSEMVTTSRSDGRVVPARDNPMPNPAASPMRTLAASGIFARPLEAIDASVPSTFINKREFLRTTAGAGLGAYYACHSGLPARPAGLLRYTRRRLTGKLWLEEIKGTAVAAI
jgi:hypothetical protein